VMNAICLLFEAETMLSSFRASSAAALRAARGRCHAPQTADAADAQPDAAQACHVTWLVTAPPAEARRADGASSRPYRVASPDGEGLEPVRQDQDAGIASHHGQQTQPDYASSRRCPCVRAHTRSRTGTPSHETYTPWRSSLSGVREQRRHFFRRWGCPRLSAATAPPTTGLRPTL
jgi:hypothetical protein